MHFLSMRARSSLVTEENPIPALDDIKVEISDKKSLSADASGEGCMCEIGKFWFPRLKKCMEQEEWGYECGFFPVDIQHRVCKDGLVCRKKEGLQENHYNHGNNGYPTTCKDCKP